MEPGLNEVLFFHTVAIQQYGGAEGVRNRGELEAAIARPWTASYGGHEAFPRPFEKAAALCESIIRRHPFVDGNKRTGVSAGAYLLETYGLELEASSGELERFAVAIARGEMDIMEISSWLESHASKA